MILIAAGAAIAAAISSGAACRIRRPGCGSPELLARYMHVIRAPSGGLRLNSAREFPRLQGTEQ